MKKNNNEEFYPALVDKIQPILNQIAATLSLYPSDSLFIKTIPVIISVFNEIIAFTDGGIVEERLKQLEDEIVKIGIELEEFKDSVVNLDEHNKFVLRRHVKDYCISALPETLEPRILSMIEFVMTEEHDFLEEICEIVSELNKTDIEVLRRIQRIVLNEEINQKRQKEAKDKIKNTTGRFKDRVYYLPKQTVLWEDFVNVRLGEKTMTFSDSLNYLFEKENGENYFQISMYSRSLLKLQNLGVIDMDSQQLLGASPINNVCQFHLTVFGMKLLEYIRDDE